MMQKQTVEFAVESKNGIVHSGRFSIMQPKINFNGENSIKWYEDKLKENSNTSSLYS